MLLTIVTDGEVYNIESLQPDSPISQLRTAISEKFHVEPQRVSLEHGSNLLRDDSITLEAAGLAEGTLIVAGITTQTAERIPEPPRPAPPQQQQGRASEAERLRQQVLSQPGALDVIRQRAPQLAASVNDPEQFRTIWEQINRNAFEENARQSAEIQRLNDDFSEEGQRRVAERIRLDGVMQNYAKAMQETPEVFGRVHMLFIPLLVNNVPVKAFVDSGAQTTIISPRCAEECNLTRLIDERFAGQAVGVGTANILGRIHYADIQIGSASTTTSLTVLEGKGVDLLLGLDMLKRHQVVLDFKRGKFCIYNEEVDFLSESEIPKMEVPGMEGPSTSGTIEQGAVPEPAVQGPDGINFGARTGAILPSSSNPAPSQTQSQSTSAPGQTIRNTPVGHAQNISAEVDRRFAEEQSKIQAVRNVTGVSEEEARHFLEQAGWNVEFAAGLAFPE